MIDRRHFLMQLGAATGLAAGAVALPALAAPTTAVLVKPRRTELTRVGTGDRITAASQNAIVDWLNELSEAIR